MNKEEQKLLQIIYTSLYYWHCDGCRVSDVCVCMCVFSWVYFKLIGCVEPEAVILSRLIGRAKTLES